MAEIKKKWSDIKVEAKKCIALHRQSAFATGMGKGTPELTPFVKKAGRYHQGLPIQWRDDRDRGGHRHTG